jgi:hypothetical protein
MLAIVDHKTFLTDLAYGKPSSRVMPACPQF